MKTNNSVLFCLLVLFFLSTSANKANGSEPRGGIDWIGGFISGTGFGTAAPSGNRTMDRIQAMRAAEIGAYRALSETINGVRIDTEKTMHDVMADSLTKSRVEGLIRGAEKVSSELTWEGDTPQAMVELRVCINSNAPQCKSQQSITSVLSEKEIMSGATLEEFQAHSSMAPFFELPLPTATHNPQKPVTGLVLQLSQRGNYERSLFPVVVTLGEENIPLRVYSAKRVKPDVIRTFGVVRYTDSVESAIKDERIGENPVVVKVAFVEKNCIYFIDKFNAKLIEESTRYGNDYLSDAKVIIAEK
jgi:hypothetical protein